MITLNTLKTEDSKRIEEETKEYSAKGNTIEEEPTFITKHINVARASDSYVSF